MSFSPTKADGTSLSPRAKSSRSRSAATASMRLSEIGRFSHALRRPARIFSRLYCSRRPSFFTTKRRGASIRSYVVKRCLQRGSRHSRRRRTTVSSSRESTTRVSLLRQVGQVSGKSLHPRHILWVHVLYVTTGRERKKAQRAEARWCLHDFAAESSGGADFEHLSTTNRALTLSCRAPVLHRD